jgi:predicted acyl esterase
MRLPPFLALCVVLGSVTGAHAGDPPPVYSVFGGRIPCTQTQGVRFCEGDVTRRVETWDGIPLDVNVTLPPQTIPQPYALIIEEHGWSLGKVGGPFVARALAGYAVLSYTARGFHASCGTPASREPDASLSNPTACERGWTHLADARYEIRDTQHLAGLLADEGWVIPNEIGVTGASYGGGRTITLAALRNRVMLPDGTLVPWESPGGTPMEIAAGAALIPWSDLPASLTPNGNTLDYRDENPFGSRGGVRKDQWNDTLLAAGRGAGFYAPRGADPGADLDGWNDRTVAGEPYDNDSAAQAIVDELTLYHSGYYVDDSIAPAPLFIYNAWTDDLFPATEGLRYWKKARAHHPTAELAVLFADDFGHSRATLGFSGGNLIPSRIEAFFARHLQGTGDPFPEFETFTQGCNGASPLGAFTADDWQALHPGEVAFTSEEPQTFDQAGGAEDVATALAPLGGGPCRTVDAETDPGAATYVLPAATGAGYTLLGSPTIIADLVVTGAEYAQVAGRLWDVGPDAKQTLVTHGFYRPRSDNLGSQVFQLPPNGWHFAAGHAPKLELLGQSVPTGRASAGPFTVRVERLELRLPVHEPPDGGTIRTPAAHVMPASDVEPPDCPPAPLAACAIASKSSLGVGLGKKEAKDRLAWSWQGVDVVEPGSITGASGATLCLWDGENTLLLSGPAPSSGGCGDGSCWSTTGKRARYSDRKNTRTGTRAVSIKAVKKGTRAAVGGGGERLGAPVLPIATLPVTVQLLTGDGTCLGAVFPEAKKNDAKRLTARARP